MDLSGAVYRVVIQDFEACVEDEVAVNRGDCVRELFRDGDWVFVATTTGSVGFIPGSYCRPISALVAPNHHALERNSSSRSSFRHIISEGSSTSTLTRGTQLSCDDLTLQNSRQGTHPVRASSAEPHMTTRIQALPPCDQRPTSSLRRRGSYMEALGDVGSSASASLVRQPFQSMDTVRNSADRRTESRSATPGDLPGGNYRNCDSPGPGGAMIDRRRQSSVRSKLSLDVSSWAAGTARKVRAVCADLM